VQRGEELTEELLLGGAVGLDQRIEIGELVLDLHVEQEIGGHDHGGRRLAGLDRGARVGLRGVLQRAQHVLVVVRLHDLDLGPAPGLPAAADVAAQVLLLLLELLDLHPEGLPFGGARGVGQVRLVGGSRRGGDSIHACEGSRQRRLR